MKILVLGAVGRTGRHVVTQAVSAGHQVTALARDPEKLGIHAPNLVLFSADASDSKDLIRALEGQDAVICVMGNSTPKKRNPTLVSAVASLVELMQEKGPKRLVYLSTILVPESRARAGWLAATIAPLIIGNDIADHIDKERAIISSPLDWTIVRATKLGNGAQTGRYLAGPDVTATKVLGMVSRSDLAKFMLEEVQGNRFVRAKPLIVM